MVKQVFNTTVKNSSWPEKGATFLLHQFVKDCISIRTRQGIFSVQYLKLASLKQVRDF